ncbi:phosphotransferase [Rhodocytophaga aerolata]|uniref:Phosphotransferase n=1 Tax=Rhodocytophaga aerolata TaxID=455078 RepID=A0ABT8RKM2_9BACT|nr:phosphotransferase [Rhodocytophaga aerolata]MDO1451452.1 phosphotransferase [Rhodocytophaga aerolata]
MSQALVFPVTYSLISSQALQEVLLPLYLLPMDSKVVFLYQGMHDTYLIQGTSSKCILRIYRAGWKTFEQVEAELQLLVWLKAQGLSVSYPIADLKERFIQKISSPEGERYAVLFSYAQGEKLSFLNPSQALVFGRFMAQMHLITANKHIQHLQRDYQLNSILDGTLQAIQTVLPAYLEAHDKLDGIHKILNRKLTPTVVKKLKMGICHGDPHYENIFLDPSTNQVTMYDFDFSGYGFLLYDLGSFCFYERANQENISSFLEGYNQLLPISPLELDLVPCFTVLMRLFHLGARCKNADGIKNPLWFPQEIGAKISDIEQEAKRS